MHTELRFENCHLCSQKGAEPLERMHQGSRGSKGRTESTNGGVCYGSSRYPTVEHPKRPFEGV